MREFVVYSDLNGFNEIAFNGKYPNFMNIFMNHASIILNISQNELDDNIANEGEVFFYLNAYAGAEIPIAYKMPFQSIEDNAEYLVSTPRSIYILDIEKEKADALQENYGIIVQSTNSIDDNILNNPFFKELKKDDVYESGVQSGWSTLLNIAIPPSNALVIADNFIFNDTESVRGALHLVGISNLLNLLDKILPLTLAVEYHITIITEDKKHDDQRKTDIVNKLNVKINKLRPYDVNLEVVFINSEHLHKRRLIMNYINSSCDKGFSIFKVKDNKTVRAYNDIRFNRLFSSINQSSGDTDFSSACEGLGLIKKISTDLSIHINNGNPVYLGDIKGGCNPNFTLKNRLINDV